MASKAIRDVIEELAAEEIERGIAVSRFNQRGAFSKALYDGGQQERGLASQYRAWAEATSNWPRTSALLRQIADELGLSCAACGHRSSARPVAGQLVKAFNRCDPSSLAVLMFPCRS